MNKVFLIGRLTRDPELRYTGSNIPVATFSIAVNRNFTNQSGEREADFINIIVWRKQAENIKNYVKKEVKLLLMVVFKQEITNKMVLKDMLLK